LTTLGVSTIKDNKAKITLRDYAAIGKPVWKLGKKMNHINFKERYQCSIYHGDNTYCHFRGHVTGQFHVDAYDPDVRTKMSDGQYMVVWAQNGYSRRPGFLRGYSRGDALNFVEELGAEK